MSQITELYVWVIDDPTGMHGILAVRNKLGLMQAASSQRRVADMARDDAAMAAAATGLPVRLLRFTLAETVDEV